MNEHIFQTIPATECSVNCNYRWTDQRDLHRLKVFAKRLKYSISFFIKPKVEWIEFHVTIYYLLNDNNKKGNKLLLICAGCPFGIYFSLLKWSAKYIVTRVLISKKKKTLDDLKQNFSKWNTKYAYKYFTRNNFLNIKRRFPWNYHQFKIVSINVWINLCYKYSSITTL